MEVIAENLQQQNNSRYVYISLSSPYLAMCSMPNSFLAVPQTLNITLVDLAAAPHTSAPTPAHRVPPLGRLRAKHRQELATGLALWDSGRSAHRVTPALYSEITLHKGPAGLPYPHPSVR